MKTKVSKKQEKTLKTNQVLTRGMGGFDVFQRTSDGYFDGNALLNQWNKVKGNTRRRLDDFKDNSKTLEFLDALKEELIANGEFSPMADIQVIKETKGRNTKNGKTPDKVWMHPYLFMKFAMWINPRFEVKVIKFVYDQLIEYRIDAGIHYKDMAKSISKIVQKDFMKAAMQNIARAINYVVFGKHESGIRNAEGCELKIKDLLELEKNIIMLIDCGYITNYDGVMKFLRKRWSDKWQPKVLTLNA